MSLLLKRRYIKRHTTFAKIKGQFLNTSTKSNAEKDLMRGYINKHYGDIRLSRLDYCELKEKLQLIVVTYLHQSCLNPLKNHYIKNVWNYSKQKITKSLI